MPRHPAPAFAGAILLASGLACAPSRADTFDAGTTVRSLIQAIERAEARPGRDIVQLPRNHTYGLHAQYVDGLFLPVIHDDLIVKGHGATLKQIGGPPTGFLRVAGGGRLELRFVTLSGATDSAIVVDGQLVLRGTRLSNNIAYGSDGGAIRISETGSARLFRSVLDGNSTSSSSLGFQCRDGDFGGDGGGIYNAGRLRATGTTFVDNETRYGANSPPAGKEASTSAPKIIPTCSGIGDVIYNSGHAVLVSTTLFRRGGFGNLSVVNAGRLRLVNATVQRTVMLTEGDQRTFVTNSYIHGEGCGTLTSRGHNVTAGDCRLNRPTDRWLGPIGDALAPDPDETGRVPVLVPEGRGPLLDAADPARCPQLDTLGRRRPTDGDQDGAARCDVGAVEFRPGPYEVDERVVGFWYEPSRDGHFLLVEQPEPGRLTVFWATYDANGDPLWLFGTGPVEDGRLTASLTLQRGMRFGSFDRDDLAIEPWGELTLDFRDCANLQMTWTALGSSRLDGEASLTRLTQIETKECLP